MPPIVRKVGGGSITNLIILGTGPSRQQCPYDCEVWGVNTGYRQVAAAKGRIDKVFICHTQVYSPEGNPYFNWEELSNSPFEVVSLHRIKELKATPYPFRRIRDKFKTEYFSDTICYMVAYALDMCTEVHQDKVRPKKNRPYDKLFFYGVDMMTHHEYGDEKGGIEYWIGRCQGLGLEVEIALGSELLMTTNRIPYGFTTYTPKYANIDDFVKSRMAMQRMSGQFILMSTDIDNVKAKDIGQVIEHGRFL